MKDSQFVTIQGWMGNRLGLRGNDLICFAVIYGFSMDGESQFKGNLEYLCACMFASKPTVLLALNKLTECNLILKQDNVVKGKKRCYYATNVIYDEGTFMVVDTSKAPLPMTGKDPLPMTSKGALPKKYNNKEYKEKDKSEDLSKNPQQTSFLEPAVNEKEVNYNKWLIKDFPRIVKMKEPLSYKHFCILRDKYGEDMILSKMEALDNDSQYYKKKISAYRTLNNWCREDSRRGDYGK